MGVCSTISLEVKKTQGNGTKDLIFNMELVPTTTQQLDHLAKHDPNLAPFFAGVFASDKLPSHPVRNKRQGYIVNLDKSDQPGSHWIAIWTTDEDECDVMDSFGMPLEQYGVPWLEKWIETHWTYIHSSAKTLQAVDSESCGMFALWFLIYRSMEGSMEGFLNTFSAHDYVKNGRRVGTLVQAHGQTRFGLATIDRREPRIESVQYRTRPIDEHAVAFAHQRRFV